LTTIATLILFYWALRNSSIAYKKTLLIIFGLTDWLIIQTIITFLGVYNTSINSMPPKLLLFGIAPPILLIIFLFSTKRGRNFIDRLPIANITYLHIVRIPVEVVLLWLFLYKAIPQLMTFEGRNFDILAGLTAPLIVYYGLIKGKLNRQTILIWNFICLGLLANIVGNAILSAPFTFQKFAFNQPNIAIFYFPFSWLPTFVVPMVLFCHLVSIRQLNKMKKV
jgi:hypothetical protein